MEERRKECRKEIKTNTRTDDERKMLTVNKENIDNKLKKNKYNRKIEQT